MKRYYVQLIGYQTNTQIIEASDSDTAIQDAIINAQAEHPLVDWEFDLVEEHAQEQGE